MFYLDSQLNPVPFRGQNNYCTPGAKYNWFGGSASIVCCDVRSCRGTRVVVCVVYFGNSILYFASVFLVLMGSLQQGKQRRWTRDNFNPFVGVANICVRRVIC